MPTSQDDDGDSPGSVVHGQEPDALERARGALAGIADRARSLTATARTKVDAARDDRTRRSLHADLGELYHRALAAGREAPDAAERDVILAALDALDSQEAPQ